MKDQVYITSMDEFLELFGFVYDPTLPKTSTVNDPYFHRPVPEDLIASFNCDEPQDAFRISRSETYIKEPLCYNGKKIMLWRKLR